MAVSMDAMCDDLAAEGADLDALVAGLDEAGWATPTPAPGWTVADQIAHLAYFDDRARDAFEDPAAFRLTRDEAIADPGVVDRVAEEHRHLSGEEIHAWFTLARAKLLSGARGLDPSLRVPWYGPDMSLASSITARIMETWAHGQDVADALGVARTPTDRLKHVAFIGFRALPNSYWSRGKQPPEGASVLVTLTGPGGDTWTFGDPAATDRVSGPALDFCLAVTQRRHLADLALAIEGPVAEEWMGIAQAFAGGAGAGRQPGQFAG